MPDRHDPTRSHVISIRVSKEVYNHLQLLIARSPLPHDTVGGYLVWLIHKQALRKR